MACNSTTGADLSPLIAAARPGHHPHFTTENMGRVGNTRPHLLQVRPLGMVQSLKLLTMFSQSTSKRYGLQHRLATVLITASLLTMEHTGSAVESNKQCICLSRKGTRLKATLIGSTAVSWWVDLEYATEYDPSGTWISPPQSTGTKVGKVRPVWMATSDPATTILVQVSNDDGQTWQAADNLVETSFSTDGAGNVLRYAVSMTSTDRFKTPVMDSLELFYEEGYPDRPRIDVGADGNFDWESILFLNESAIDVSDDSVVGVEVDFNIGRCV